MLFWLVNYPRNASLKDIYGVRESNLQKVYRRILRIILPYTSRYVALPSHEHRQALSRAHGLPREFGDLTMIVDGTDMRCWIRRQRGEVVKLWRSYKFRKPAFRTQCVITADGKFVWFSNPIPASRHDVRALRESNITQFLQEGEKLLADTGYLGLDICVTPHRRPRNGELSQAERQYNQRIQHARRPIEQSFGRLKTKFAILREAYRHEKLLYPALFGLCLAIYNQSLGQPYSHLSRNEFVSQLAPNLLRQIRVPRRSQEHSDEEYDLGEDQEDEDSDDSYLEF